MPASTVLLLGSDPDAREEVRAILAGAGYAVTEVETTAEANARASEYGVLVVDLVPDEGGAAQFCRMIRENPALTKLPILAVAQADDVEERVRLFEAGADEVMARPFDPRELEARMVALGYTLAQPGGASSGPAPELLDDGAERRVIACFSPKGGTGVTTIAVNVAAALASDRPGKVAIFDLDMQFGQVVTYLIRKAVPKRTIAELAGDAEALDEADLMRSYATTVEPGLDVYAAPTSPAQAELVTRDAVGRLLRTARGAYEVVVIDAGSHLDDTTLDVFERADSVIIAVRPEMAALRAVHSLVEYLGEIGAIGSRTIYVANHLFSGEMVKLAAIEDVLGARVAVEIPYDPFTFLKAVNEGVPVVRAAPRSTAAESLAHLAAIALGEAPPAEQEAVGSKQRGLLPGLKFSR